MDRTTGPETGTRPPQGAPPRWRERLLAVSMFLCVASFGFLEPFVPLYLELSGLERAQIGLVAGTGPALALLLQPLLGRLSDRLDARRPLMCAAAVLAACAYWLYRGADHLAQFMLLSAVGVNGTMYLNTANSVLVGRTACREGNGQAGAIFAAYRVWGSVGYIVVSLLSGWLLSRALGAGSAVSRAALSPVFLFGPLLFVLVAGLAWLLPDPRSAVVPVPSAAGEPDREEDEAHRKSCERNLRRFLRAYFLYLFAYTGCGAYLSLYLKSLGASPLWMTAVFATGVACEVAVMTRVGRLSDRYGRRPLLAVAFLLMPVRLFLYVPAPDPLWVLCVQSLHGLNFGIMVAVAVAFVSDLCAESERGMAQAKLTATSGFAAACGPAAGGWIAQQLGVRWTFGVMACVAALGAALFLWKVRESHAGASRLYRIGPARLRPLLGLLCVPGRWLSRRRRWRRQVE